MNGQLGEHDLGWRKCATCGVAQRDHGPGDFDHRHAVRPGDEWCSSCDDLVVNGCGSLQACREEEERRELDRAEDWGRFDGWEEF